jgi:hypothetical protein
MEEIDWKAECLHALELAKKCGEQMDDVQKCSDHWESLQRQLSAQYEKLIAERDQAVELAKDAVNLARTCWRLSTSPNNAVCNALESRLSALTPKEEKK